MFNVISPSREATYVSIDKLAGNCRSSPIQWWKGKQWKEIENAIISAAENITISLG
jgi:uncharacterized protein with PIN domain